MFAKKKFTCFTPAGAARFLVGVAALLALAAPALAQSTFSATYCTYTQGGWGAPPNGNNPGTILKNNFSFVYPSGFVEVGIPGTGGFSMTFTTAKAIEVYLPAGKTANALNADLLNPTSSPSGVFGGQVLALQLGLDFNFAGIIGNPGFLNLVFFDTNTSFDGLTVLDVLAAANWALGGGSLADVAGVDHSDFSIRGNISGTHNLNDLVSFLNQGFDNCIPSDWVKQHLMESGSPPPPPG